MSLVKNHVRDGKRKIIGSVTSGFSDSSSVVRGPDGQLFGRTSERFNTTRNKDSRLVSANKSDTGLLFKCK
jgi:hypothetical protein